MYPLYFNIDMHLKSAIAGDEKLIEECEIIKELANEANDSKDEKLAKSMKEEATKRLSKFLKDTFYNNVTTTAIDFTSDFSMMKSFETIVNNGAKGNKDKLITLADYYGVNLEFGDDGNIVSVSDTGHSKMSDTEAMGIMKATGYKSDLTGKAGSFLQKGIGAFREKAGKAISEITYTATQGTLQIKHNPKQADIVSDVLLNKLDKIYEGINPDARNKEELKLTRAEFENKLENVITKDLGTNINKSYIKQIAKLMESEDTGEILGISAYRSEHGSYLDEFAYSNGVQMDVTDLSAEKGLNTTFDKLVRLSKTETNILKNKDGSYSMYAKSIFPKEGIKLKDDSLEYGEVKKIEKDIEKFNLKSDKIRKVKEVTNLTRNQDAVVLTDVMRREEDDRIINEYEEEVDSGDLEP